MTDTSAYREAMERVATRLERVRDALVFLCGAMQRDIDVYAIYDAQKALTTIDQYVESLHREKDEGWTQADYGPCSACNICGDCEKPSEVQSLEARCERLEGALRFVRDYPDGDPWPSLHRVRQAAYEALTDTPDTEEGTP